MDFYETEDVILPDGPCESGSSEDPGPFSWGNCEIPKRRLPGTKERA